MTRSVFGLNLDPLRNSQSYRRLYVAGGVTAIGNQATYVTLPFQLKVLTHSTLAAGLLGLVEVAPLVLFGLYGGVLADSLDRRRLVIGSEALLMLTSLILLVNASLPHPKAWVIYIVAMLVAALDGVQRPSLDAVNQSLVSHELQREAATLGTLRWTTASIIGPVVGGLLAVSAGPWAVYGLDVATFLVSLVLLSRITVSTVLPVSGKPDFGTLVLGVRYAASRPDLIGTYLVDLAAMIFAFPVAMMPFVADRFHVHYALALLYCGLPVGALVGSLTSLWTQRVSRYGKAIVVAAAGWGLGIAVFGSVNSLFLALLGLIVAGWADAVSGIFRSTMWNESIPLEVRGRMAGIELISYSLGPTAGQFRSGLMASLTSLRISLTVGGLVCTGACVTLAAALPSMWRFDARTNPDVLAQKIARGNETAS